LSIIRKVIQISPRLATLSAEQTSRYFSHADFSSSSGRPGPAGNKPAPRFTLFPPRAMAQSERTREEMRAFYFRAIICSRSHVELLVPTYRKT